MKTTTIYQNDILLRAARGEKTERTPVWLMRQAGRVLPEYRAVRAKTANFIEFVKNPELAAEVTIQPVDILGVDAAIIFSDILVIPETMGLPYQMEESKGPIFPTTICTQAQIDALHIAQADGLDYVIEAIKITKKSLNNRVPLIGFAGAPFTIFCYMVEGSGSKTFSKARKMMYQQPEMAHLLLDKITTSTINYLKAQIVAGADIIQLFDSWAGILPPAHYSSFAIPYLARICEAIQDVPKTVFAKGAFFALKEIGALSCDVVGLDWNMRVQDSREQVGYNKVLQGNLDPCTLYANEKAIIKATKEMIDEFGTQRHIANLGHGLYPDILPQNVKIFINTVKEYSGELVAKGK